MKTNFRLGGFIFLVFLVLSLPGLLSAESSLLPIDDVAPEISMDFQDANLKDILKLFSIQSGLNFIASEALQNRKITLYLDHVSLKGAMDKLFNANNLSYELDREANIFIVKDWGKLETETETRVFYLKYATVSSSALEKEKTDSLESDTSSTGSTSAGSGSSGTSSTLGGSSSSTTEEETGITKALKKLLSKEGSVTEDARTNSLIVTDTPGRMRVIAQVIASLDVSVPQVMLEVEMLDVSKGIVDKLGFDFTNAASFAMKVVSASRPTSFPLGAFSPESSTKGAFTFGKLSFPTDLQLVFDFLRIQTDTKVLARPRILTLNNETAEIKITTQEYVGPSTIIQGQGAASSSTSGAERAETGVSLRVTPQINPDTGDITMFINPAVKASVASFNAQFKDPEERSTKSVVRIKDGETVIVGGLIRTDRSETITKLPILGDIPLIGGLFKHKYKEKDRERELLVFITPHIIKDAGIKLARGKRNILPEREQDTALGVSRGLRISSSLSSFQGKREY